MLRKLDRYIMKELLGPLTLGFLVYTFIMLLRVLFRSTELIIARGAPADMVGRLLLTAMPNILVLTIPMALLFGILTAVSRLSSESELTAMRASGVSLMTLYRPILVVSALLTLLNTGMMVYALPWGNTEFEKVQLDIVSQGISQQVQPRVFWDDWEQQVLYVSEIKPDDDRWYGVFMAEALPTSLSKVTFAEWGRLTIDESGEEVRLKLVNATTHEVNLNEPERYRVNSNQELNLIVDDRFTSKRREERSYSRGVRSLNLPELHERIADPTSPIEVVRLARVEIHKRFSIPAACLVFG